MFHAWFYDLLNFNRWQKKSRCIGFALLQYCDKLHMRLESEQNPVDRDRMESAIDQALKALDLVNNGHEYDQHNSNDPAKKAEDNIKQLFQPHEFIQPSDKEVPKDRLTTATRMIKVKEIAEPAASSMKYPVDVNVCDSSAGSVNPISETLKYSFTGTNYTLDDLLYIVRLRRPNIMTEHPYFYCRPVRAHRITQEGSKFERRKTSDSLMGLSRTGQDDIGVVYFIAPQPKFILLVEGVPFKPRGQDEDGFYIVKEFGDFTTEVIAHKKSQTRTFHHVSETSWGYKCGPNIDSEMTWRDHRDKKQLTPFEGEWFVCIE